MQIGMNSLIISGIGVILTFTWIVNNAPPRKDKLEGFDSEPIKKIEKSGSNSINKIKQTNLKSNIKGTTESKSYLF